MNDWKDALAVLGTALLPHTLAIGWIHDFEIVEYAHPKWKPQPWGTPAPSDKARNGPPSGSAYALPAQRGQK